MSDLRQFFDTSQLDEQQLGQIEFVLNSPAYEMSFRPYLQMIRDNMHELMLDRSEKRQSLLPDDYLAGAVASIDGLLKFFTMVIHETSMERIHESMAVMTPDKQYELRQTQGRILPVVGANQSAEPDEYRPEDDY